nr:hypothetical protein CFP56_79582 [Quercus suber]
MRSNANRRVRRRFDRLRCLPRSDVAAQRSSRLSSFLMRDPHHLPTASVSPCKEDAGTKLEDGQIVFVERSMS